VLTQQKKKKKKRLLLIHQNHHPFLEEEEMDCFGLLDFFASSSSRQCPEDWTTRIEQDRAQVIDYDRLTHLKWNGNWLEF
jgi:hypothetical protein